MPIANKPMLMAMLFVEIHQTYVTLLEGGAPPQLPEPSGYDDYCVRQHQYTSALTADSPLVRQGRLSVVPLTEKQYGFLAGS